MKKAVLYTIAALLLMVAFMGGGFALKVALSGPVGQGQGIIQKNSAQNWTAQQALFEDLYAGIQAQDKKVTAAAKMLATDPKDKTYQQTYTGLVSACESSVGEYNATARKFLAADFKAADLPYEIDQTDVRFDCKETK